MDPHLTTSSGGGSGVRNKLCPTDTWGTWLFECACCGRNRRTSSRGTKGCGRFNNRRETIICGAKIRVSLSFLLRDSSVHLLGKDHCGNWRRQQIKPSLKDLIVRMPGFPQDLAIVPYLTFHINYDHQHHMSNQEAMESRPFRDDLRLFVADQFRCQRSVPAVLKMLIAKAETEHSQAWHDAHPGEVPPLDLVNHMAHMDASVVPSKDILYKIRRSVLSEKGPSSAKWDEFAPHLMRLQETYNNQNYDSCNGFINVVAPNPVNFKGMCLAAM